MMTILDHEDDVSFKQVAKRKKGSGCWWLTPVILTIQEAEIRRIKVQSQPGETVLEILSQKHSTHTQRKGWQNGSSGGVTA
jgi:hypothetical protein